MIARNPANTTGRLWTLAAVLAVFSLMVKLRWFAGVDQDWSVRLASWSSPTADTWARVVTFFGSAPWVLGVMGLMSAWWWSRGERRMATILWGAWTLGMMVQVVLRLAVAQWRPDAGVLPDTMDLVSRVDRAGFTSGHGFRAAFLYGWWGRVFVERGLRWAGLGCGVLALGVGLTRVYLRRHWMSDVAGSLLVATLALAAARYWQLSLARERPPR